MMWRPVLHKIATYDEVANKWTLNQLMDCLEILDIQSAIEDDAHKRTK